MYAYTLTDPKTTSWESRRAQQFFEQLLFTFDDLIFRIVARHDGMRWQIIDLVGRDPNVIETAIATSYPEAQIEVGAVDAGYRPNAIPVYRYVIKYQYALPEFVAPILYVEDVKTPDPLALLTHTMSSVQPGEQVIYTLIRVGHAVYAYAEGEKLIYRTVRDGSLGGLLFPQKVPKYIPEHQRVFEAKLQTRLYQALLMIQIDAPTTERLEALLAVDSQIVHFDTEAFNAVRFVQEDIPAHIVHIEDDDRDLETSAMNWYMRFIENAPIQPAVEQMRKRMRLILEPRELAALWHLPHEGFAATSIQWAKTAHVEMPKSLYGKHDGLCLGVNRYAKRETRVFIPQEDRLTHALVVGKTGIGKSNFLHQQIHQDIAQGRGVAVIDPHGKLVESILACSIPPSREADVVLLELGNMEYPLPLNPLRGLTNEVGSGRVVDILRAFYPELEDMAQTTDALENALLTLQPDSEATLRDVNRLFTDPTYQQQMLRNVNDEVMHEFWFDDFGTLPPGQQRQISAPVTRRIRAFYRNPILRTCMCHPDGLDFATLIQQGKIILVSLKIDPERLPELEQHLIGALIVARLQVATMSGAARANPFYCYIDETQHLVTSTLDRVFSEARKFNLSLTLAHQYLGQLAGNTLKAVMGNVGMLVAFQCGDDDARALAHYTQPNFTAEALVNLDKCTSSKEMRHARHFAKRHFAPLYPTILN